MLNQRCHQLFSYGAYRKCVPDPKCFDRRSGKKKKKNGTTLKLRHNFPVRTKKSHVLLYLACSLYVLIDCLLYIVQCAKQPHEIILCGYYVCEHLRACPEFSTNWRELKKAAKFWRSRTVNLEELQLNSSRHVNLSCRTACMLRVSA